MRHFPVLLRSKSGTAEVQLGSSCCSWVRRREAAASASAWALQGDTSSSMMQVPHLFPVRAQGRFAEGRDDHVWVVVMLSCCGEDAAGLE